MASQYTGPYLARSNPYDDELDLELWDEQPCAPLYANAVANLRYELAAPSPSVIAASATTGFPASGSPTPASGYSASTFVAPSFATPVYNGIQTFAASPGITPSTSYRSEFKTPPGQGSSPGSSNSPMSAYSSPGKDDLRSLMPAGLNVPLKPVCQFQPTVVTPEQANVARSCTGSLHDTGAAKAQVNSLPHASESGQRKKLFGDHGWLDYRNIDAMPPVPVPAPAPAPVRKPGLIRDLSKRLKQQFSEITEEVSKQHPFTMGPTIPNGSQRSTVPISLDPITQAKLYSDLEFMICATANKYLLHQYYDGRVSQQSINKVNSFWGSKNRPRVTEFHFDQATQQQLIMANRASLHFSGESSTNPIRLHSNLRNWKVIAQEMSVRTFCLPDSAIRKHLFDLQKILDMLDAPLETMREFQELSYRAQQQMTEVSSSKMARSGSQMSF
ncbi:uncharacterized protein N7459_002918 [Penicillium hispanicum]|uniref:uncharacterized protein n=1 Tax=Penicillium hispanicum TaxID=1080232 RepID=UPI00254184E4|nr:uncharacterized protein N7459_002918 [Penicillium hispanicum]KAJ5587153.1 hypothetical protein N7459_002918 [Penicillium hispanicum]